MRKGKLLKTIISVFCICSLLAGVVINGPAMTSKASDTAVEQKKPEVLGYERLALADFVGEKEVTLGTSGSVGKEGAYAGASTLNGKYLDVDVTTAGAADTKLTYGGGGAGQYWWGVTLIVMPNAISINMAANPGEYQYVYADFANRTFNLKVATNVVGDDVQVDLWIDNVRQNRMTFTGAAGEMGTALGVWPGSAGITVGTPEAVEVTPEDFGYQRIKLGDFVAEGSTERLADGAYTKKLTGTYADASNLYGKYLDVTIKKADDGELVFRLGGNSAAAYWAGAELRFGSDKLTTQFNDGTGWAQDTYADYDVEPAEGTNVKVAINQDGENITMDIWLDDTYVGRKVYAGTVANANSNWLMIDASSASTTLSTPDIVKVKEYTKEEYATYRDTTKALPEMLGYKRLTLTDFIGKESTTISAGGSVEQGAYVGATTLNGKYLDVDVTTAGVGDTKFTYGGGGAGQYWWGVTLNIMTNAILVQMTSTVKTEENQYVYADFDNKTFNLKVATNVVGDDVQVDLWIDNVRQNRMIFTGAAGEMGTALGVWPGSAGITVDTPEAVEVTPEDFGYQRITLGDFVAEGSTERLTNGAYTEKLTGTYADASNLYGKYLDITIKKADAGELVFRLGGNNSVVYWAGAELRFGPDRLTTQFHDGTGWAQDVYADYDVAPTEGTNVKVAINADGENITMDIWLDDTYIGKKVYAGAAANANSNWLMIDASGATTTLATPALSLKQQAPYKAPVEDGYVFAGWYVDQACTEPFVEEVAEQNVYAKFVPKKVLSVKSQITANLTEESEEGDIRFLTTVDSDDYDKVGFDITIDGFEPQSIVSTSIYKKLYYVNSQTQVDEETTPEKEFSNLSKYFMSYAYWQVPNAYFDTTFTVTPWWITADGTLVYGDTVTRTVNEGIQLYAAQ